MAALLAVKHSVLGYLDNQKRNCARSFDVLRYAFRQLPGTVLRRFPSCRVSRVSSRDHSTGCRSTNRR